MKSIYQYLLLIICLIFSGIYLQAQEPTVYYSFNNNANDQSALHNDASVNGAYLTQDRFGIANRAFSFDGKQAYIQAPNDAALNSEYATVSFWINADSLPPQGEAYLISLGGWQERFKVSLPSHGKMVWTTNNTSGISDMDSGDGNVVVPGVWQHWVFVHDGTNDQIYLNGAKIAEKAVAGTLNPTTHPLGIGYNAIETGNFFKGRLDEVQIYDFALNATEIQALYDQQNTAPTVSQNIVAQYNFDNNGVDKSDFQNHASFNNATFTTDRFGFGNSAAHFNGSSSEVNAANSSVLNSGNTTIILWLKANSLPVSGESFILSNGGWQQRLKISLPSHGKVVFTTNSTSGISDMDAGTALEPGKWYQLAFTHDGTNDKIFINGVLANSKAVSGDLNPSNAPLGIGYNAIDGGNWFDGDIDDVTILNTALPDNLILDAYNAANTFPGALGNRVAEYNFAGNQNDGTILHNNAKGSATATTDRFDWANNASYFNGTDSMYADNSVQLNSPTTTISFWVKPDELPVSGESFLISNGGWQQRLKISLPSHGKVVFTTNSTSGISDMDAGDGHALSAGVWTHVAVVHDGTNDKIYINGALANSKAVSGDLNPASTPFGIGYNSVDHSNFFKGSIDDIIEFNEALDDAAIAALYGEQSNPPSIGGDLVAYYPMDGNSNDISGYNNHLNSNGAQFTNGRFGLKNHAYSISEGDSLSAPNSAQQNSAQASIAFWINANDLPPSGEYFILSNGGWQERWKISLPSHGKIVFTTNNTSGISDMDAGDGNVVTPGTWQHFVMTHDGSFDRIYLNGNKVAEKAVTGDLNNTTKPLGIGWNPIDGGNYFNGSIDEVMLYKTALTDQQVLDLYNAQNQSPAVTDSISPSAPLNLAATVNHLNINLNWLPSTDNVGVAAYNVFQNGEKVATTSRTNYTAGRLNPLTEYKFAVTAVDSSGNESIASTLSATSGEDETPDVTPPTKPGNLAGSPGAYSVLLTWEASIDDRQLIGYVVSVDGSIFDSIPGTATSILVTGLDPQTPYSFEIYAYDKAGNNSEIAELTLSTTGEVDAGEPGLVAYYPLDGNADDATPYKNNGTIGGDPQFDVPTHANGGSNYLKFDGDQDSVKINNAVQLISDYTTVAFWIQVNDINIADAESYILDFGHWNERWKISLPQHLRIVWTTNSNTTQFPNLISDMDSKDGNELVKGFWWYVVMVHDGVNDQIYINGELVNSKPAPGKLNTTDNIFCMGSNPVEGGQYFNGGLDEVKIYNKALTAEEISKLYETGTTAGIHKPDPKLGIYIKDIYPNPTQNILTINHNLPAGKSLKLRIMDAAGRQVNQINYDAGQLPAHHIQLTTKELNPGVYFINFLIDGKDLGSLRFVKQ